MAMKEAKQEKWHTASESLLFAFKDFILSRQAMRASYGTMRFYNDTAGAFIGWLASAGVTSPGDVTARHVRAYLAEMAERTSIKTGKKLSDKTCHGHARAIKTMLRFWHEEGYLPNPVKFDMPKLERRRLPVLDAEQVAAVLKACANIREKALLLFAVDTGLRLAEMASLSWCNLDMDNGVINLERGKSGKSRTVIAGAAVRRALLAYRRTQASGGNIAPIFQSANGGRLSPCGISQVLKRLSKRAGVPFSAHALRRSFCVLSLRAGMSILHVQTLMGHASLEMTRHYAESIADDILSEHREHSPIDNLTRLKKR